MKQPRALTLPRSSTRAFSPNEPQILTRNTTLHGLTEHNRPENMVTRRCGLSGTRADSILSLAQVNVDRVIRGQTFDHREISVHRCVKCL